MAEKQEFYDVTFSCCVYNLRFYGVWWSYRTILASFIFSGEEYREAETARIVLKRLQTT